MKMRLAVALCAVPLCILPVVAGAVETDRITVEDPSTGAVKFKVTSDGNVTAAKFIAEGKLGIGTANPSTGLHVSGASVSTGNNDGIAAVVDTTLSAGKINDFLYGLKLAPVVNANGFTNPLLYSLYLPGASDGIVRMRFDNTSAGTAAQAGIEMNNDIGQALMTFYSSKYSATTLQNYLYFKNAVGGVKFVGAPGSTVGFGIGTTAASANNIFIDSTSNVGIGSTAPAQKLEVKDGGVRINISAAVQQPTCSSTIRGTLWVKQQGTGLEDTLEVCVKGTNEAYFWKPVW